MIEIISARIGYREKGRENIIFPELNGQIEKGVLYCILGANGIGKTTLFRSILGLLPLLSGKISIDGRAYNTFSRKELARTIAYVPQYHHPPFPYTVEEVVMMGRGVHISEIGAPKSKDAEIVEEVMKELGILRLRSQIYTKLSGGERQLTLIARALAQEAQYLLLDEPAASLDYGNQINMLKVLQKLALQGIGVCFTTHHPDHAFWCKSEVMAIAGRDTVYTGTAEEVITKEVLKKMYGVEVMIKGEADEAGREQKILMPVF